MCVSGPAEAMSLNGVTANAVPGPAAANKDHAMAASVTAKLARRSAPLTPRVAPTQVVLRSAWRAIAATLRHRDRDRALVVRSEPASGRDSAALDALELPQDR